MLIIPEKLREAHEDGDVVFVCGSGVSYDAGLPTFSPLVKQVLNDLLPHKTKIKKDITPELARRAFKDGKLDEALDILERSDRGGYGAKAVRESVRQQLDKRFKTLKRHETLVQLTDLDTKDGRMVTTNFDPGFQKGRDKILRGKPKPDSSVYLAPALPPGKKNSWQGLVYLHGRLDSSPDNRDLVLTAADFGKAYLTDGGARRFMIDLFRDFHVVFIGYSADDPIMAYLVKAMAAERTSSKHFKTPYAFTSFGGVNDPKTEEEVVQTWQIKGVEALPYDSSNGHEPLWDKLDEWARDHRQGLDGRQQKITRYGKAPPSRDDDPVIQELAWALKDKAVARYFARLGEENIKDRPSPRWIPFLQTAGAFSLSTVNEDEETPICPPLISHTLPDHLTLHSATDALGPWIAKCIDCQETLDWALTQGGVLHLSLRWAVQYYLNSGKNKDSIPVALKTIWKILASDEYAHLLSSSSASTTSYHQVSRLAPNDLLAKRDFLNRLRPIPKFTPTSPHFRKHVDPTSEKVTRWCEAQIILVGFEHTYDIENFKEVAPDWDGALADMAEEITTLLFEAMQWHEILGKASPENDPTYFDRSSISSHEQNRHRDVWTQLIDLTRDSFDALMARNNNAAERLARRWQSMPYPVFRRLTLYAATGGGDD